MTPAPAEKPGAPLNPDLQRSQSEMPSEHEASAPLATVSVEENHRSLWPVAWVVALIVSILIGIYLVL